MLGDDKMAKIRIIKKNNDCSMEYEVGDICEVTGTWYGGVHINGRSGIPVSLDKEEYMELNRTCQEITGTNSKIQAIIENNESVSLTKEEVELLVKYFTSCIDRMLIEQKKMFYLGGKYFYYLMKEMELVK